MVSTCHVLCSQIFHFEIHTSSANMDDIFLYPLENYNSRSPKLNLSLKILIINFQPFSFKNNFSHNLILAKHIVLMMTKEECSCLNLKSKNMDKKLHVTNRLARYYQFHNQKICRTIYEIL